MFEYLMPLLVTPVYEHTLLDQTCKAVITRQISYGKKRGVPGHFRICLQCHRCPSQLPAAHSAYRLGLKGGLAEDLVIAPYASALALMVAP